MSGGWQPDPPHAGPDAGSPINPDATTKLPFDPRLLDPYRSGQPTAAPPGDQQFQPQAQPQYQPPGGYQQPQYQPSGGYQQPQYQPPGGYQQPQYQPPGGYQQPQFQPPSQFPPQGQFQPPLPPAPAPAGAPALHRWWPAVNTLVWLLATGVAIGALLALA